MSAKPLRVRMYRRRNASGVSRVPIEKWNEQSGNGVGITSRRGIIVGAGLSLVLAVCLGFPRTVTAPQPGRHHHAAISASTARTPGMPMLHRRRRRPIRQGTTPVGTAGIFTRNRSLEPMTAGERPAYEERNEQLTDSFYGASGTSPPRRSREKFDVRGVANYAQIRVALARLLTFKGNSMSARWEKDSAGDATFVVYSYRTPIAGHTPATGETWTDDSRFSRTTSKHQGYVRRNLPGASHVPESGRTLWTGVAA